MYCALVAHMCVWWYESPRRLLKRRPQLEHACSFSLECVRMWTLRLLCVGAGRRE